MQANERLQDAIGQVKDEYVLEAHEDMVADTLENDATTPLAAKDASTPAEEASSQPPVLSVIEGEKDDTAHKSNRNKQYTSIIILFGVAASLAGAFLIFRDSIVSLINSRTSAFSSAAYESADITGDSFSEDMAAPTSSDGETVSIETSARGVGGSTNTLDIDTSDAFVLTAGEWNDNLNWPFFTNLVNAGTITFPVFDLDPTRRVRVELADESGAAVRGREVALLDADGGELWRAQSGKDGVAYLFYRDNQQPAMVVAGDAQAEVVLSGGDSQGIGTPQAADVRLSVSGSAAPSSLQVMFIVDTTGSMSDELAYLQKDFSAIAGDVGSDGVSYSVNFYRDEGDEYVTRCNGFTSDIATVQQQLAAEYADGGGDTPEAVAQILEECITNNKAWQSDASKVAFLVFDAPPHHGTEAALDAAVRSAAARGIRLVPVVASNAERETELFGRALAILTNGTYVFLTDDSGVGESHLTPIIGDYQVALLHDVIVRIIEESR